MKTNNGIETFYAKTRPDWRNWLDKYGQSAKAVCLIIYHKKSKTQCVSYNEAVEEALCFGWIDSKANKRDHESYYQAFTPRKAKSNWSELNKARVEQMIKEGKMTEHGQKLIDFAKQTGKWDVIAPEAGK
jgi:uncharacterized protein YdeI (YjbR/CyaY-like superfamily)